MFQLQKRIPRLRQRFVRNGFKNTGFSSKNSKSRVCIRFLFKFHKHVMQTFLRNVRRDFSLPMSTLAGKSFKGQIYWKKIRSGILSYHCWYRHWSLKSLHTLFDKYLDHMLMKFEKLYKILSFMTKKKKKKKKKKV